MTRDNFETDQIKRARSNDHEDVENLEVKIKKENEDINEDSNISGIFDSIEFKAEEVSFNQLASSESSEETELLPHNEDNLLPRSSSTISNRDQNEKEVSFISTEAVINQFDIPSKKDIDNLLEKMTNMEKNYIEIKKEIMDVKVQNARMERMMKEFISIDKENNMGLSIYNRHELTDKYLINIPIKSRADLDAFEKEMKENSQCKKDTKDVMANLIYGISDGEKAAVIIFRKFITAQTVSKFFLRRIPLKRDKENLKDTHPNFVDCIMETLVEHCNITEDVALRYMGVTITKSPHWIKKVQ